MITYIILALALVGAVTVVRLAVMTFHRVVSFLRNRQALKESDRNNIAFSLQEKLAGGQYETVYGIFNKRNNKIYDHEVVQSNAIDSELAQHHRNNELVVMK